MSHEAEIRIPSPGEGYDRDEPQSARIGLLAAGILLALLLVVVGVQAYFEHARERQIYEKLLAPVSEDLTALRAREDAQLHSFGYIDRKKGVVRLPIERAMELMEKEYAAGGKVYYSTKPTEVKPPEPATPAPGTPAAPGAAPAPGTPGAPVPSKPNAVGQAH